MPGDTCSPVIYRQAWRIFTLLTIWLSLLGALLPTAGAADGTATITLDPAEKAWLQQHASEIRVGVIEIPPLVMRESSAEGYHGLAIEFMRRFETLLGVRLQIVRYSSWKELLDAAREKQVDLVLTTVNTPERRKFLNFPPPYVTLKNVIISRQGDFSGEVDLSLLSGKRVAVLEASAVHERIVKEFPQVRVHPLREEKSLLSAVAFHEVDFAITELSRAVWWMQHEKLTNLRVAGSTPFDYGLSVAVRNDWPEMTSVLSRMSGLISDAETNAIMRKWSATSERHWLDEVLVGRNVTLVATVAVLLLMLAMGAIFLLRRQVASATGEITQQLAEAEAIRQRMEASEQKFRQLAELTSDVFWETNDRLVFTRCHGGGVSLGLLSESFLIGKAWWDLPLAGVTPKELDQLKSAMEAQEAFHRWICQIADTAGRMRWISISGQPVLDAAGGFLGFRGTGQDVTDRMVQQERLSEALQRMQAVQDGTYSFLGLLSPEGRMLECNRSALDFIGRQRADVIGRIFWEMPWWRFDEEAVKVRAAIEQAAAGEFVRFDARVVDVAGATRWVDFSLSPYFDESGTLIYLVPEARDVTEAKRAATALDNLMSSTGAVYGEAFFPRVVEAMGRLLAVKYVFVGKLLTAEHRVRTVAVWAGDRLGENIEYDLAATPCNNVMNLGVCVYPRDVRSMFPEDELLQQMGVDSYVGVPLIGASGQSIGILVVLHDKPLVDTVSMRRLMELFAVRASTEFQRIAYEDEIRTLNVGLEARVAARTAELQLANRELEAFSYSVSHDLRAPLRHISGFIELLVEEAGDSLSDEGRRYIDVISQSAARMGVMIDDLLAFSRAGRSEVRRTVVNLRQLVDEVIQQAEHDTKDRHISWKIDPLPEVRVDRNLMSLVLGNLIGNAIKYSRQRDPAVIEIGLLGPEGQTENELVCFVRDNGVGFDMKYAHKLFGVFQRLHNDSEYEGTGIGLANVRRIIERHGGRVWATGEEGRGATFYFALPVINSKKTEAALAA